MSADEPVVLPRPDHRPRSRRLVMVGAALAACFSAGSGFVVARHVVEAEPIIVAAPPVTVTATAAPPAITVVAPEPPPPPPPAPEPVPEVVPVRATTPYLDPACIQIGSPEDDEVYTAPSCSWDEGFPAVSQDGSTIVMKHAVDDGGRGNPNLTIRFLDVKTSKVIRDVTILDPDEVVLAGDQKDEVYFGRLATLRAKVARRAEVAQKLIDGKGYRSLQPLGVGRDGWEDEVPPSERTAVYAQFDGGRVRVVDPATNTSLWSHTFGAASPHRSRPDDDCSGFGLHEITLAWDPETRIAIADMVYFTGGCMCPSIYVQQIVKK